ncbi:MAG: c-type cytochrome [Oligoflexia bacterium]|nr:c-type cytochrome [Oligoflexia bacterium]
MSSEKNREKHDVPLSGHEYDGIQEFDNSLPRWWVNLFYITIVFAGGYFAYYELGPGPTLVESYERARAAAELAPKQGGQSGPDENVLLAAYKDPAELQFGKNVYLSKCASCHAPLGQGLIGPNLTDEHWLHGGSLLAIAKTIAEGVPAKGMPPWAPMLNSRELISVAGFVKSLKGTNPPNPKAPQGEVFKE